MRPNKKIIKFISFWSFLLSLSGSKCRRQFYQVHQDIAPIPTSTPHPPPITFEQSPLCAVTNPGGPLYRYYKPTRKCYVVGEPGPCGELMEFTLRDNNYGMCDCSQKLRCGRPLVFWPPEKRCYFINEQGPCRDGDWLLFGPDKTPFCNRNPCRSQIRQNPADDSNFWFEYRGRCYKTGERGYCAFNEILLNMWSDYIPLCYVKDKPLDCVQNQVYGTDCLPGLKWSHSEECRRKRLTPTGSEMENIENPTNVYHLDLV